jgi:N-acetylneuraminic acid mutarotase
MRYLNVCFLGLAVFTLASCSSSDDSTKLGNWITKADYQGDARREAVGFVIGDTAYVGTGFGGADQEKLNTFYKYDPVKDNWTQVASLQNPNDLTVDLSRSAASAFAAAGKGYVSTGVGNDFLLRNDTWAYDPTTNSWASKAAYPGVKRSYGVGFAVGDFGYIGTGYDGGSYLSDFFKYNPSTDTWTAANSLKDKRRQAITFVINDSAYIVTGLNSGGNTTRMFVYDASADQWNEKAKIENATDQSFDDDYTTLARYGGVGFVINNKGYIATGTASNTWEYDPINDRWTEKTAFDGTTRTSAVGLTVKGRGFVTTGAASSSNLDDTHEFDPTAENNTND